jgi:capsular polysaccharide biosynthesis protein
MELKDYLKFITKRIWLFLAIVAVIIIGTYYNTIKRPNVFTGNVTFYTVVTNQITNTQNADFYGYDSYYSTEASKNLVDTLISWFKDPSYVSSIYGSAKENLPDINLKKYSKLISTQKTIPSTFSVSISSTDEEYVKNILAASKQFVKNNIDDWTAKGLLKNVKAESTDVFVVKEKPSLSINLSIALVVGLFIGFSLVYFLEYLKQK